MAISVGAPAINRSENIIIDTRTLAGTENPANANGIIYTIETWFTHDDPGVMDTWFGTFSAVGNVLTCRDSESVGDVTAGSKQTFSGLSIDVEAGDFIGLHDKGGNLSVTVERDNSGSDGYWNYMGEVIDPSDSETFEFFSPRTISLYGTGEEAVPPAGHSFGFIIG